MLIKTDHDLLRKPLASLLKVGEKGRHLYFLSDVKLIYRISARFSAMKMISILLLL